MDDITYGLFNDAVSSSDYKAPNDWMILVSNELEGVSEETVAT
jgi:hypothetical protein